MNHEQWEDRNDFDIVLLSVAETCLRNTGFWRTKFCRKNEVKSLAIACLKGRLLKPRCFPYANIVE
jgi:hypothetical protein